MSDYYDFFVWNIFNRMPSNSNIRCKWDTVLKVHECGSSNLVCMEHFTPNDYTIGTTGKIYLKSDAIPSVFDIYLIEVDDDGSLLNSQFFKESQGYKCSNATCQEVFDELQTLKSVNVDLLEKNKQLTRNHKNAKNVLTEHLKRLNSKQSKEILSLKKTIANYKMENEKLQKAYTKIHGILDRPEVNIFYLKCRKTYTIEFLNHFILFYPSRSDGKSKRNYRLSHHRY